MLLYRNHTVTTGGTEKIMTVLGIWSWLHHCRHVKHHKTQRWTCQEYHIYGCWHLAIAARLKNWNASSKVQNHFDHKRDLNFDKVGEKFLKLSFLPSYDGDEEFCFLFYVQSFWHRYIFSFQWRFWRQRKKCRLRETAERITKMCTDWQIFGAPVEVSKKFKDTYSRLIFLQQLFNRAA